MSFYRVIAKAMPQAMRARINDLLSYSGIKVDHENFVGFITLSSVLMGLIAGFFLGYSFQKPFWIFFTAFTVITNAVVYLWLAFMIDKKAMLVEEALPDALQLMASNLRAGMTPSKALLLSSRPEFGPLKEEIDAVGKKVTLGKNVGTALMEMAKRVRSRRLLRSVELINSGLDSGGSLASLLEATSNHLREQFLVDKKIKATITMYVIFIFSAAAIITPILLGLSSFLVEVLHGSLAQIEIPATASLPIQPAQGAISIQFLFQYIIIFLLMNCFLASLILGLIRKGRKRDGIRYFIPMALLSIPLFLLSRYAIDAALSGLFNF
ncbi:type II secretion system F family protein [Candidatus Woesearchaeota archaeon]|nr:type II secretion system F family protein [Candidatus Woesearchaeota archaeon]